MTVLIGVGNAMRQDDGAGIRVASIVRSRYPGGRPIAVVTHCGEGAGLIALWQDWDDVVLVDATQSAAAPGTIRRIDARANRLPTGLFHLSSHAFGVAAAVETARNLDLLPQSIVVYGIEGRNFAFGTELSPEVSRAVQQVAAELCLAYADARSAPADPVNLSRPD